jgi:hypothetical protein
MKGGRQRVGGVVDRDLALAHGLEQRRLGARRGAVDLVGQDDVGEDRAVAQLEGLGRRVEDRHAGDVRRQEVAGELDAVEGATEGRRQRPGQGGLADPGDVLDEQVAARQERGDRQADRPGLAAHHRGDRGLESADRGDQVSRRHGWRRPVRGRHVGGGHLGRCGGDGDHVERV